NGQFVAIQVNASANPDLASATSLEVFDAMIAAAKASGMKILLDVHGAEADNMGHIAPLWYKGDITSEDFFSTWEW
ncbi:cellulase family glycosylhydrolase, partial [Staphylococcus pasteuri_A]